MPRLLNLYTIRQCQANEILLFHRPAPVSTFVGVFASLSGVRQWMIGALARPRWLQEMVFMTRKIAGSEDETG